MMSFIFNRRPKIASVKSIVLFLCVAIMASSAPINVFASDKDFYSANDILFYDPDSCPVGGGEGTSSLVGNDNIEKMLRYFVGKGLTLAQASGIAGNFFRESGLNPAIIQGGKIADDDYIPVDGTGFGIAQWTFTSRQQGLIDLSKSSNRKITDLNLQLDYAWQELNNNRAGALTSLKAETTPDKAAYVFHRDFEGSADTEEMVIKNRGGDALNIYSQYSSSIPDGTNNATACTGIGGSTDFVNNFTVYNQNDPRWDNIRYGNDTIGKGGCGPSAMAMIITTLTGKEVTPVDTATYGRDNGTSFPDGGSYHNIHQVLGDHWNLKYTHLGKDVAAINKGLRDGGLVILAGTGSAPFTTGGHFIVVRAVTSDGQWLIGDSNSTVGQENSKNSKTWDPAYILSMVGSYSWLLTK